MAIGGKPAIARSFDLFRLPPVVLRGFILQPLLRLPRYALLFEKACSERA